MAPSGGLRTSFPAFVLQLLFICVVHTSPWLPIFIFIQCKLGLLARQSQYQTEASVCFVIPDNCCPYKYHDEWPLGQGKAGSAEWSLTVYEIALLFL